MKQRTLTFQMIADSRFNQDLKLLNRTAGKICLKLLCLPGVEVRVTEPYQLSFPEPDPCLQWRVNFWVRKDRRTTWNQIMETVNKVFAPAYKFI